MRKKLGDFMSVTVSGYCLSEGRFFYRLKGVIGAAYADVFKVWPEDESVGDGKLWFSTKHARYVVTDDPFPEIRK